MTKQIHTTDGITQECELVVRKDFMSDDEGYRLYWRPLDNPNILIPALGLATSLPFIREKDARNRGLRLFNEKARRIK